jgi:hypothetical protein
MRAYAYVTTETCLRRHAVRPGALIGRDEIPVSRHGDYAPWPHGKRETLRRMAIGNTGYTRASARAVADLFGWVGRRLNTYDVSGYMVTMTAAQAKRWNSGDLTPSDLNTITVYRADADREVTLAETYALGWDDLDEHADLTGERW